MRSVAALLLCGTALIAGSYEPLVGRWTAGATPMGSFVPKDDIAINLRITPEGAVQGAVGVGRGLPRWFTHADYIVDLGLRGDVIQSVGTRRSHFTLYVTEVDNGWRAFAATDGSKLYPWASEETMRARMRIQTKPLLIQRAFGETQ